MEKIYARLSLNLRFFLANYFLAFCGVAVVVVLMNIEMVLYVVLVCALWWMHRYVSSQNVSLIAGGKDFGEFFTPRVRSILLTCITFLVVMFKCLGPFLNIIFVSGFLILLHATMRDPKHKEGSRAFDDARDANVLALQENAV